MLVYATKQRGAAKYFRENSVIISSGEFKGFYGFYGTTAVSQYVHEVMIHRVLYHEQSTILILFLQHWAPISAGSWLTPWSWHFKVPKHVGECRVSIHWRITAFNSMFVPCIVRRSRNNQHNAQPPNRSVFSCNSDGSRSSLKMADYSRNM
jgi:hypothetical protein